ncbi:hypothetical protein P3G55_07780 [Leptospira sp. 96542]|nr:hypothetical protein [Leptospira sp. 96542]
MVYLVFELKSNLGKISMELLKLVKCVIQNSKLSTVFLILSFSSFSSCITWIESKLEPPMDSVYRQAKGEQKLTISFRHKGVDYSKMTEQAVQEYNPQMQRWLQPGMDLAKEKGIFKEVEYVGLDPFPSGRHISIEQGEDSNAWTITNAILAGLTLNWFPTYLRPDHIFKISYSENGTIRKEYQYRFTYHSLNWNLFIPFWLFRNQQVSNDKMMSLLFQYLMRDLINDGII